MSEMKWLDEELRWHVKYADNDQQEGCDICGNDEPPCVFEFMAGLLRWAGTVLEAAHHTLVEDEHHEETWLELRSILDALPEGPRS
jgi:hypothetical protein